MQRRKTTHAARRTALVGVAVLLAGAGTPAAFAAPPEQQQESAPDTLREAAPEGFRIGTAAAGGGHHTDADYPEPFPNDPEYRELIAEQFSSLTAENQMKWEELRPDRETFDFDAADAVVEFAEEHGQVVRGHVLMWHSQNPEWLENGDFTEDELRQILREHITTVVGHYEGRIQQWEVANEIFDGEGQLRTEENIWLRELGPGIIADAFRWAHEADPDAKLFFNDYGVEGINAKSDAYYDLITDLLADDVPVHGFGAQAHLGIQWGFDDSLQENLQRFAEFGLETAITELDVRMPLPDGAEPTEEQLQRQAEDYRRTLEACLAVDTCNSFTVWGVNDRHSWVPGTFSGQGAATIMSADYTPKPAYYALLETLQAASSDDSDDGDDGEEPGPSQPRPYGFFLNDGWDAWSDHYFIYGRFSDEVLIGDWDGDGTDSITVRRGNDFYINNAPRGGDADAVITYGRPGDVVLVGDWDGDGRDTLAVRRGSEYHVRNSLTSGAADVAIRYGRAGDQVVVGDWDSDDQDTLAVRRGNEYHVKNTITGGDADEVFKYGRATDVTLAGDWDGDGADTFAVRRGNEYHVRNSLTGGPADIALHYGRDGDEVYVGDWNGDGTDTLGVRRAP